MERVHLHRPSHASRGAHAARRHSDGSTDGPNPLTRQMLHSRHACPSAAHPAPAGPSPVRRMRHQAPPGPAGHAPPHSAPRPPPLKAAPAPTSAPAARAAAAPSSKPNADAPTATAGRASAARGSPVAIEHPYFLNTCLWVAVEHPCWTPASLHRFPALLPHYCAHSAAGGGASGQPLDSMQRHRSGWGSRL